MSECVKTYKSFYSKKSLILMASFLTLGDTSDGELGYFKQLLDVAQTKVENSGYAERRAQEMGSGDMEDYSLEEEVTLAMEEI